VPSSYLSLHYHIIFATKHRQPLIADDLAPRLHEYLGGIVRGVGGQLLIAGGIPDHVHLLVRLKATRALSDVVRDVKANSSGWVHDTFPQYAGFGWQTGYAAFAVSLSGLPDVREYIATQAEHHREMTFEDEFVAFLKKHEIEYDERYLWD